MEEKRRSRLDFWQNIAIVALSLTAVLLFSQTQLCRLGSAALAPCLDQLFSSPSQTESAGSTSSSPLAAPLHVAVTGAYGCYGSMGLVTSDEDFRPLGDLLREALGSARTSSVCSQGAFLDALKGTSVFYDFLTPLPLSVLAQMVGTTIEDNTQVRRLVLSAQADRGVQLYIQDGSGICQCYTTAVSRGDLEQISNSYELGNASFAFELAKTESAYAQLDPYTLFLSDSQPALPVLRASRSLPDTDQLLSVLQFNPRTNYRYPESDGTQVIVEGERSLRIRPNGSIFYRSGGEDALTMDASLSDYQTAAETISLLQSLLGETADGELYLQSIRHSGTSTVLQFGYHVNGTPVFFSNDAPAAEVTLNGGIVSILTLRFRQYTATGDSSVLLPLRQALAIAEGQGRQNLTIGYADYDTDTISANWLAE